MYKIRTVRCMLPRLFYFSCFLQAVEYAKQMLSPVKWAEVCFTSAKTGQRCTKVRGVAIGRMRRFDPLQVLSSKFP